MLQFMEINIYLSIILNLFNIILIYLFYFKNYFPLIISY